MDLWPYRRRTVALLRRYGQASVEVGRVPSLLGREFFRSRVSSYTLRNFEDVVIFVADMERAIEKLDTLQKKLLGMNVLEEYYIPDMARLLGCNLTQSLATTKSRAATSSRQSGLCSKFKATNQLSDLCTILCTTASAISG